MKKALIALLAASLITGCSALNERLKPKNYPSVANRTPVIGKPFPAPVGDCNGARLISYPHNAINEPDIIRKSCRNPLQYHYFISCSEGEPEKQFASYNDFTKTFAADPRLTGKVTEVTLNFYKKNIDEELILVTPECK